ncbi:MAG: hypothetical protein LC734_11085 [Acidobacteria bacterium]|nr:hypothetical protein [Acidobacteriota bacterium]
MNIRREAQREHSKSSGSTIVEYIGDDAERFAELMRIFLEGEYRLTQSAAWPIIYCVERFPSLVEPHLRTLLDQLERADVHDAVKRKMSSDCCNLSTFPKNCRAAFTLFVSI